MSHSQRAPTAPEADTDRTLTQLASTTGMAIAAVPAVPRSSRRVLALRAFLRTPSALVGLVVAAFWVVCALFWPLFAPDDPYAQDYNAILARPSPAHLFGTDEYGRDVLSRVLAGSREVLTIAPTATLIGLAGGILVGLVSAYYRGWLDEIVMRVMDAIMAFPIVVLALLILAGWLTYFRSIYSASFNAGVSGRSEYSNE